MINSSRTVEILIGNSLRKNHFSGNILRTILVDIFAGLYIIHAVLRQFLGQFLGIFSQMQQTINAWIFF